MQTAQRCLEAGAKEIYAHATHLVMAGESEARFTKAPIRRVIGSDSYPGRKSTGLIEVYSLAPLIASVIETQLQV